MDPKYVLPNPDPPGSPLGPAQADAAAPDDIGSLFQRFCRLHGITPRLAVALANLWLRQEQIARLQAMHAGHPRLNGGSAPVSTCRSLCKVAEELGHVAVPLPQGDPTPLEALAHLTRITKEAGEHAQTVCQALEADNRIDRHEAVLCLKELGDLLRAATAWRQVLLGL